jgi:hypothetical protein
MKEILAEIEPAQDFIRNVLIQSEASGGLTKERYARFLIMQYHLTKGVQRHFLYLAGHPKTSKKKELRKWLVGFAYEEEFHYDIARMDLEKVGVPMGPCPLDVKLWWLFFDSVIQERPFMRLGATCILENVSAKAGDVLDRMIQKSDFLNPSNLRFLTIHRHGPNLDHGNQILEILKQADLSGDDYNDAVEGAKVGATMYERFFHWIMQIPGGGSYPKV